MDEPMSDEELGRAFQRIVEERCLDLIEPWYYGDSPKPFRQMIRETLAFMDSLKNRKEEL